MPVEIKELHVRINVGEPADKKRVPKNTANNKEMIVAECVEQVMQIISNSKER